MRVYPSLAHRVLPAARRDHPAYVTGCTTTRQVPPLHHGARLSVHLYYRLCSQHILQVGPSQSSQNKKLMHSRFDWDCVVDNIV